MASTKTAKATKKLGPPNPPGCQGYRMCDTELSRRIAILVFCKVPTSALASSGKKCV